MPCTRYRGLITSDLEMIAFVIQLCIKTLVSLKYWSSLRNRLSIFRSSHLIPASTPFFSSATSLQSFNPSPITKPNCCCYATQSYSYFIVISRTLNCQRSEICPEASSIPFDLFCHKPDMCCQSKAFLRCSCPWLCFAFVIAV